MAKKRKQAAAPATPQKPLIDISEDEQWRIIRDSGVLKTISSKEERSAQPQAPEELLSPFTLEVFAALALIIPFSSLLLMMEILVHYQYGRKPTFEELADRMIPGVPIIAITIFYSNRYKNTRPVQAGFFLLGTVCGARLIYMINWANWRHNMKMLPPLATAWIYGIAQLNLGPAVASLAIVGALTWYKGWKLSI
ncbi:hypothetical protein PHLGIDRAFT_28311 [Phlebiopsis gigantea 11061_1 CR5-6]|uniref:DUF7719 domain-containing protein n=1 Tax=Phlebiopsis gigantea (strain 11061_1 CR5-6) TaxID=745531 RepID=A0A0C3S4F9_PHLG1|nr:hypothetical protein PHLGIDRAFT_28311 [Phlebiopsis gigantea 11061_1 CR5-6]